MNNQSQSKQYLAYKDKRKLKLSFSKGNYEIFIQHIKTKYYNPYILPRLKDSNANDIKLSSSLHKGGVPLYILVYKALHACLLLASIICWTIFQLVFLVGQDRYQKDTGGGSKKVPVAYSMAWLW